MRAGGADDVVLVVAERVTVGAVRAGTILDEVGGVEGLEVGGRFDVVVADAAPPSCSAKAAA
jgi:hypothetical protein